MRHMRFGSLRTTLCARRCRGWHDPGAAAIARCNEDEGEDEEEEEVGVSQDVRVIVPVVAAVAVAVAAVAVVAGKVQGEEHYRTHIKITTMVEIICAQQNLLSRRVFLRREEVAREGSSACTKNICQWR